jgi:hypothetical protein
MGKDKIALAICFCLIVALAGFSTLLYVGAKGLESKVSDLESKTSSLETQNAELNEKVQNLTNWRDAFMDASNFTFMGTEQLTISTLTWTPMTGFTLKIDNAGTKDVTITQIQVNYGTTGVTQPSGLPLSLKAGDTTTLTVTFAYVNGTSYDISVVTSSGYKFTDHFVGGQNNTTTQAGVMLKKDSDVCLWKTGNVTIYIRNIGTSDAEIDKVYINSAPQTSVTYTPSSKIVNKDGGTITIVVFNFDWQADTEYHFQISPKLGEPLSFDETSP